MKPEALAVIGRKGAGRSQVLARLVSLLRAEGLRIGVIKHVARPGFEADEPGTDSFEYRACGAEQVVLSGNRRMALFSNRETEATRAELLAYFEDFDLVFLEGYYDRDLAKIEVHRAGAGGPLTPGLENVIEVCSDPTDEKLRGLAARIRGRIPKRRDECLPSSR